MFTVLAPLFVIAAAGFVAWPLLKRRRATAAVAHDEAVRALYRARLNELELEQAGSAALSELREELGAVLLTEQTDAEVAVLEQASDQPGRRVLLGLALAVPLAAFGIVNLVADLGVEEIRGAEAVLTLDAQEDAAAIESWRLRLTRRVADAPSDAQSYFLLGHAQLKQGRFGDAAQAFASAHQLADRDIGIAISWLQARYLAANGILDGTSRALANDILSKQPDVPVVLEILAMDTFRAGQKADAVTLLNRAVNGSRDMGQQASYATALAQVRAQLESPPSAVQVSVQATAPVPHAATIFVSARPVGGGMPYAAVKRPAVLVPFAVVLDDLVSMSPGRTLSSAEEFEVSVRLSHRGVAMPEPNDWQWTSAPMTLDAEAKLPPIEALLTPPSPS